MPDIVTGAVQFKYMNIFQIVLRDWRQYDVSFEQLWGW